MGAAAAGGTAGSAWTNGRAQLSLRPSRSDATRPRRGLPVFLGQSGVLGLCDEAYTEVGSVLPCLRVDQTASRCARPSPTTCRF